MRFDGERSRTIGICVAFLISVLMLGCERTQEDLGALEEVTAAIDTATAAHAGIGGLTDQEAIGVIALVNNASIETAQLATTKAQRTEIRQFAQWLLQEHDRLNTSTRITADTLDIDPISDRPPVVADTREEVLRNLRQMPAGAEWDRMYLAGVQELHSNALERLRPTMGTSRYIDVGDRVTEAVRLLEASLARVVTLQPPPQSG